VAEKGGLASLPNQEESLSLVEKQELLAERIRREGETSLAPVIAKDIGRTIQEVHDNMSPLDKAALYTAPVPLLGDVVGGVADTAALIEDPSLVNAGLMAAGLIPFVPSGGVTRTAQKVMANVQNEIPGFYAATNPAAQAATVAKTIPQDIINIGKARYDPSSRALQDEFNISVADQRAADKAIKVSEEVTPKIDALEARQKELRQFEDGKYPSNEDLAEIKRLEKEASKLRRTASQATKQAMGQLNQSRSFTNQYFGPTEERATGLKSILDNIDKVDHVRTFKQFNVDDYIKEVGDVADVDKKDMVAMFDQVKKMQRMDPTKPYQMNIRRANTGSAGNIDPGMKGMAYRSTTAEKGVTDLNLTGIKNSVFSGKTFTSDKKFLDKLQEAGVRVLNPEEVLKGRAAIIKGSAKTDAYEMGGVGVVTSIDKKGKVVSIVNDEHDLFNLKLPGGDRYMNVSTPLVYELVKNKTGATSATQKAAKNKLSTSKTKAVDKATKKYESILKDLNVDIAEKVPEGFGSREQYLRALTVANLKPSHKDYSRLVKDFGIGAPTRAARAILGTEEEEEEVIEVQRKRGGSVIERDPYNNYAPKAI
jgi:hypothetical protein